jgi:hypothetical protein
MTLREPYKQYEGKWLSSGGGALKTPIYYIVKFIEIIEVHEDGTPSLSFLVVNEHGISNLSCFPEPSFIHEHVSVEKHHEIIIGIFKGFYH